MEHRKHILTVVFALIAAASFSQTIRNGVLTIANGTTEIKNKEYYGNTEIKKVIIPSSVTKIEGLAFHNCSNLTEIEIPSSVKTIGNAVFQNCTSLTKVTLHEGLTNLSYRLFKNCTNLTEITIPSTVKEFGTEVFSDCKNLTAIRVDRYSDAHTQYSMDKRIAFTNNRPKQTKEQWLAAATRDLVDDGVLYIKPGTTKINGDAYVYASNFTKVVIPSTVTEIGAQAFFGTKVREVTIPGSVKIIKSSAFYCSQLEKAILEEGVEQIDQYAFNTYKKLYIYVPESVNSLAPKNGITNGEAVWTVVQGSYAEEYVKGKCSYEIDYTKPYSSYSGSKAQKISIAQNVSQDYFKNCPNLTQVDIGPDVSKILPGTFGKNVTLRTKRNTYADEWCKQNGYYQSGVLADLNTYTKDRSKEISEDFTRILCDDDSYAEWTSYSFNTHKPLKLEEVDGKLVLTSFMLKACQNVTVTAPNGKALIKNKTIQPLTRTVLCDFNYFTDNVENYTLTTTDAFYKTLSSIPTNWNISFSGFIPRASTKEQRIAEPMTPAYAREWIALVYDMAYVLGLPEYDERCYKAVENKELVTNQARTEFMTKEQMEKLIKKARDWSLVLGRDNLAGSGGGTTLTLIGGWILGVSTSTSWTNAHAFWHEFSHCMGYSHEAGNMCNMELPAPWGEQCWPSIASKLYVDELEKGNPPYIEGRSFFNSNLFSKDGLKPVDPEDDVIENNTLYIADTMPFLDSHSNQTDFTKVVFSNSVQVIKKSALYGTAVQEITIPTTVKEIESLAFHSSNLSKIVIPDSVKSVGDAAFQNCSSLKTAKIGSGLKELNMRLFKSSALKEITIPSNIKVIGNEAFQDCKNLRKVVIENGVQKIGDNAFNGTAIEEIEVPASVTEFGKNITASHVVWIVKLGTAAYDYALSNKYTIKLQQDDLTKIGAEILAQSKNAESAPTDKWQTKTFTSSEVRRKWDFSTALDGSSKYIVTFTYTSGESMICMKDALFTADGKAVAYFPEQRTAGNSPRRIVYEINVPTGTKKLELYALARRSGNGTSNGTVVIESLAGKLKNIMAEITDAATAPTYNWSKGDFTQNDTRRRWDFSSSLNVYTGNSSGTKTNGSGAREYTVTFTFTTGNHKLCLSDVVFTADGKPVAYFSQQRTASSSPRKVVYEISVPNGTKKLEMFALAKTSGGTDSHGTIVVFPKDDGTKEWNIARVIEESKGAVAAPSDMWDRTTVYMNETRRLWDFSSSLKGNAGGKYYVTFRYGKGDNILCLSDVVFTADGKSIAYFPDMCRAGSEQRQIVYEIDVPARTKKLEMIGITSLTGSASFNGTISVESLSDMTSRIISEGKNAVAAPIGTWAGKTFTNEYTLRKWDFSSYQNGGGNYTVTMKSTGGDNFFYLYNVVFIADGKLVGFYPATRKYSMSHCEADYTVEVPAGSKKLEMFGYIKGNSSGTVTITKN